LAGSGAFGSVVARLGHAQRRESTEDDRRFVLEGGRLGGMPEGLGGTASPEEMTTAAFRGNRRTLSLRCKSTRGDAHCGITACYQGEPRLILARMPIAPCHLGAGALAHLRELGRLSLQLVVLNRTQRRPPTGRKPWCLEARGKRTQRLARCPCPARGHTRKVIRGNPGSFSFLVQCRSAAALTLAGLPIGGRPLRGACRPPPGEAPWPYTAAWSGSAGCAHTARGIDPPHRGHRGPHATAARCPRGPARGCAHGLRWRARAPGWSPQRPPRLAPPPSWA
jgi:hypothetical protein